MPQPPTPLEQLPRVVAPAASAEDDQELPSGPPLALQLTKAMVPPANDLNAPRPAFVSAQRLSGVVDRELVAEGDAEVRKVGTVLTGDRVTYWPVEDEVEALGNARLQQGDDVISGPRMRLKVDDQVGFIEQASYFVKRQSAKPEEPIDARWAASQAESEEGTGFAAPRTLNIKPGQTKIKRQKPVNEVTEARGDAERVDLEGENQIRLTEATFTTCKPGNDDWYLRANEIRLDYDTDVGTGHDASVHFLGVPIFYTPWVTFALNNERKSGFLAPSYGTTSDSGAEISVPYYWNIAPNMDATFEPRILTKRGIQLGTEFRYLNSAFGGLYRGNDVFEYLPHDREANRDRWGVALSHVQSSTTNGFAGSLFYNRVSDNDYYTDLSSQITSTSKTQLLQQGLLTYGGGGWWNTTVNLQTYQTLQPDPQNPVTKPYRLLPQVTLNARQPDFYFTDSALFGQYTSFVSPDNSKIEGQRLVMQPQVSLPFVTPGWYVIPRVGVNITHYSLSDPAPVSAFPGSISRTLPIFSVDSGLTFERSSHWFGREYTQTLEPRLFYLNIPYKNQNDIPIFDTALADFNFAQIFADNQFSGWDRINNANQVTAALSSRLIDPKNGAEIMRGMIGQIFYFTDDKVALPGTTLRKWDKSDFLAAFSGQILPKVYADAALQYDLGDQQFQRYAVGARYVPAPGKLLNASYRYNADAATPINEIDLAAQWPISGRWQAVGRYTYALKNDNATTSTTTSPGGTPVEVIGGLEYNAGCWALRAVGHRIQTTQADSVTQFFVQLELSDFARIGSNPLNVLQRRIPGYSIARPMTDASLAEQ